LGFQALNYLSVKETKEMFDFAFHQIYHQW